MASRFSISGWRTSTIAPKAVAPTAMPAATPLSNIATAGYTAGNLATPPQQKLNDPTLASRAYGSTVPGTVTPYLVSSVYQQPAMPAFLQQSISDLNTGQALQRNMQEDWRAKILAAAGNTNDPNAWLYQNALQASAVSPGAHVSFGQAVQSPLLGQAALTSATGSANLQNAQAGAIGAPQILQQKIAALQREKQQIGANSFGGYQGSRQQAIESQLFDLQAQLNGATQVAAGQNRSGGWTSNVLPY